MGSSSEQPAGGKWMKCSDTDHQAASEGQQSSVAIGVPGQLSKFPFSKAPSSDKFPAHIAENSIHQR